MGGGWKPSAADSARSTSGFSGGRTPVAGMVHALTLPLITVFFGRWAALIPMATLAWILVIVSYHMSEWRTFRRAGARVILSDVHAEPMVALRRSAFGDELAEEDLVGNIDDALTWPGCTWGSNPLPGRRLPYPQWRARIAASIRGLPPDRP